MGRALLQARPRRRDPETPHRAAHQHRGAPVRPGVRRADRAGVPRRRRRHRARSAADASLQRRRPARRGGPAPRSVGRPVRRRAWPRLSRRWSTRRAGPTTPARRGCRGRGQAGPRPHPAALGRARHAGARAPPRLPAPARRRDVLDRLPLGRGRRPRRPPRRLRHVGRRLRPPHEAAARPVRARSPTQPATRPCVRPLATRCARCGAGSWRTRGSRSSGLPERRLVPNGTSSAGNDVVWDQRRPRRRPTSWARTGSAVESTFTRRSAVTRGPTARRGPGPGRGRRARGGA